MKHGYGERWNEFSLTVDKVGEDAEGNHLVEVTAHDRRDEVSVRLWVSKEYYGSMIGWVAARTMLADLVSWDLERVRRIEGGRWSTTGVRPENPKAYLDTLNTASSVANTAAHLPEHILRAHMFLLGERSDQGTEEANIAASLHNIRKQIFDRGLPDVVEFVDNPKGKHMVLARWGKYEDVYYGFNWETMLGRDALSVFLGMLNLRKPFDLSDIRPRRIRRREGPKEWSPYEYQSFMLIKGSDYGRSAE